MAILTGKIHVFGKYKTNSSNTSRIYIYITEYIYINNKDFVLS
jgi:hypothetical protein